MDDILYIIIIIGLVIFMTFYGGHNYQNKVEYQTDYFNFSSIILFEKKLQNFYKNFKFTDNNNFIDLKDYIGSVNFIIPNLYGIYYVKIKSKFLFDIYKLINKNNSTHYLMVIFNHNYHSDIELLLDFDLKINTGYFYDLNKLISITSINDIYNNSNEDVYMTIFFVKKPFWHN